MNTELDNLDVMNLLSERHVMLRKINEQMWHDKNEISISNSEWNIIARICQKQLTIAAVAKQIDISRQATHKLIKKLEKKGLVEVMNATHNKKEKCISLTPLGKRCYEENERLKAAIETKIAETIGAEQLFLLKKILHSDWGLTTKTKKS